MEAGSNTLRGRTGLPPGLSSLQEEIGFVAICSMGQLLFAIFLANGFVNQITLVDALGLPLSYSPWLIGAFLVANGISVVLSGSAADLANPKHMAVGSFVWLTICWNVIGCFSVHPSRKVLYFVVQAMSELAVGTLCSSAMSMLGRVYKPGRRKNQVFSMMGAMIPMGFAIGAVLGGALSADLQWVSAVIAILAAICTAVACWCIPARQRLRPEAADSDNPTLGDFDYLGGANLAAGCGILIFGLTQAVPTNWTPYTYALIVVGVACFGLFGIIESRPLMIAYFLAYGAFVGGCNFYACTFFLTIQNQPPIIAAVYLIPIGVGGTVAAWLVSKSLHVIPGHFILIASMLAFASGRAFFMPQTPNTIHWALSFPGLFISTFGPDLSFPSISVFITSNVPRTFQGSAGSLLITAQNLSSAVFTALAETIGRSQTHAIDKSLDLEALRDIWWFSLASSLVGAVVCVAFVRIPTSEERDHVQ
ncbi:hypothetical protein M409DRAFT_70959 [Zasmidium cellare ATCC 36951]|uniref:Major facilitator superfamily (MFS) profile domain-containing protein n=1 Tax=Zasmidium cellare ATCC 36951 TaxID=1080233 RepID=A0A6A6BZS4_ZASCE|nr:uncharacterized protein M409DRAFT_70959 [Zasmidium cellare ATCC 36951]KAF2159508.1 hypothetical protein M409DRAFT_70959 [Zasmidium cellare ATCC 36951]